MSTLFERSSRAEKTKRSDKAEGRSPRLWSIPSGQVLRTFSGHERGLACFAWDGDRVVSGGNDKSIRIWDVNTGKCIRVLEGHTELVRCLAFDAKANRIVSGSYDRVRLQSLSDVMATLYAWLTKSF